MDWWLLVGLAAQGLFAARFVVQWIVSERAGHSIIPLAFWLLSLAGSSLLLAYALYRRDAVFIFGQSFVLFVYLRNLYFVFCERGSPSN
jgi:lipid-A-disaccharide synthase-like uncharacterized protein